VQTRCQRVVDRYDQCRASYTSCLKVLTARSRHSKTQTDGDRKPHSDRQARQPKLGYLEKEVQGTTSQQATGWVIDGTDEDKDNSSQVLGLIQLHLSDAYLSMADDVATAKALWDELEATFTAQNNARRLLFRQELNSLKKAPTESISEFVAQAKELATTNLEAVGHKPEDSEITLSLLAGLPRRGTACWSLSWEHLSRHRA